MGKMKVGLQLYSVRRDMAKDMEQTLKTVKEIGYDYVEFAGYFGKTAETIHHLLEKYELECVSVHQPDDSLIETEKDTLDYLKTIGTKFCVLPWMKLKQYAVNGQLEQIKESFYKVGKLLRDNEISLLYHNHDFEFTGYEGRFLLDWIYESVPADILQTELDTCWIKYAGQDPAQYLRKYAGRSPVVHLKDFICEKLNSAAVYGIIDGNGKEKEKPSLDDNGFKYRPLGCGIQDFPAIIKAAEDAGTDYIIVGQDMPTTATAMESAKISRNYLRSFGL